ncbi:hypothetical protein O9992_22265 [Vibrio lentus]|nr:hypothetical protein [Vibrio lentus]
MWCGTDHPATLVTTADHDDRVPGSLPYKFISELQDKYKAVRSR